MKDNQNDREKGVEKAIEEAMQSGKFDNLAGKGKPLNLEPNPHADPANEMAHKILKDNNFTLPWIEIGRQIDSELESLRKDLACTWAWYGQGTNGFQASAAQDAVSQAEARFRASIAALNQRIANYNLTIPHSRFEKYKLNPDREIEKIKTGKAE